MEIRKVEKDTTPLIQLERMPQQLGVSISEEDWSGITSPTQRRALQNRINQRAYRRRLTKRKKGLQSPSKSKEFNIIRTGNLLGNPQSSSIQGHHSKADAEADSEVDPSGCAVVVCQSDPPTPEDTTLCKLTWVRDSKIIQRFEDWAARNHKLATSNTGHLLVLVKFNIWRAFISNTFVLGLKLEDTSDDDAISPFNTMAPGRLNVNLPPSLYPTRLQRAVIHHPWIDMIPISGMRDNLIRAGDSYDDMALCGDSLASSALPRVELEW